VRRLVLLRHARTAAVRTAGFPDADEPLDAAGIAGAAALRAPVRDAGWARDGALCSPLARAVSTAELLGLDAVPADELREADFGAWAGRTLADMVAEDGAVTARWMADPDAAPHGGEPLRAFAGRVGAWLDRQAALTGRVLAVTHGGVIKAAVVHALDAPLEAFWRVDVAPLSATELHAHDGRWTVARVNGVVGA
jgi:broad specificity phosphatase PhoE